MGLTMCRWIPFFTFYISLGKCAKMPLEPWSFWKNKTWTKNVIINGQASMAMWGIYVIYIKIAILQWLAFEIVCYRLL